MDLPSLFRRKSPASAAATKPSRADAEATSQDARTRARRRLIGAVVLLGVGVIAFPLLFETEPRPIPVDLPIEIPRKEGAAPLAVPAPAPAAAPSAAAPAQVAAPAAIAEPAPPPAAKSPATMPPTAAPTAEAPASTATARLPPAEPPAKDAARAQALLEGRAAAAAVAAPASDARFVVQVGAFAEERAVRDVRAQVERLGLKTYTQVVKLPAGDRTRVRVGPFTSRGDADAVAARLKKAGLPGSVLTL